MKKVKVDLDSPAWLANPAFGIPVDSDGSMCALGKVTMSVDDVDLFRQTHRTSSHGFGRDISIAMGINDYGVAMPFGELYGSYDRVNIPENHWKAVRYLLESLAKYPDIFELVGTKVHEVVKEKTSVQAS